MDYLKQHVLASAPALFVICRYLASQPAGAGRDELQRALHPPGLAPARDRQARDGAPGTLLASLAVGRDLGLLEAPATGPDRNRWALPAAFRDEVHRVPAADSRAFRGLLLRRLCERAMVAVEAKERPPDLVVGLSWLLLRDPLSPLPAGWNDGVEAAVHSGRVDPAVGNAEQWRALVRWARALGLATVSGARSSKSRLLVDPTTAIQDALADLPRQAPADRWFGRLSRLLPILGERALVATLPVAAPAHEVLASTALAVRKLERAGRLRLVAADDATSAVVLPLGDRTRRRVGAVHVLDGAT